jgi:hypothetical protein
MRIRSLPIIDYDIENYSLESYGYADVDVFTDETELIGERVNCIFRKKDLEKVKLDECEDISFAILCNDCGEESGIELLKGLNAGQVIPIQFNNEYTPFVPYEWIKQKFWLMNQ